MKTGAIIFSRMNSQRLPGKALMHLGDKLLLQRVIERTKCIKKVNHICVATSDSKEDDIIASYSKSQNIDVYRGSLNDVAARAFDAATYFGYDNFLRVCGDRPFLDANIYDELISLHIVNNNDLTTNILPRTVPPGLTGEVIKVIALEKVLGLTSNPEDREHVTRYFYQNTSDFRISNVDYFNNKAINNIRLVIDDENDVNRAIWIIKNLKEKKGDFNTKEIIHLAKTWEQQILTQK